MDMETATDVHSFFPNEITVNAGDTIFFQFAPMGMPGAHTVTFTSGAEMPPLFMPDIVDGTPVASPEGPPRLMLNPALLLPDGRTEYDGTGMVNSGVDFLRMDQPAYTLTFTAPGTYEYACAFHSVVMKGKVTVQEAGASLPNERSSLRGDGPGAVRRVCRGRQGRDRRRRRGIGHARRGWLDRSRSRGRRGWSRARPG